MAVALTRSPLWVDAAHVIDGMRYDPDERVRAHAIASFLKATCQGTTLERALRLAKHPDPIMRIRASVGLALETGRSAREALLRLALDDSDDVREAALTSINLLQAPSDGEELERVPSPPARTPWTRKVRDGKRRSASTCAPSPMRRRSPCSSSAGTSSRGPSAPPRPAATPATDRSSSPSACRRRRRLPGASSALLDAAIDACTLPSG